MKPWLSAALVALMLGGSLATAQRALVFNAFQERLLALEAETPPFRHFEGLVIQDFFSRRARGAVLPTDELIAAKEDANALQSLAVEWMHEADELSEGLYLAPGVELDADTMYRYAAWELGRFFEMWIAILTEVEAAETTSPASSWQFSEEIDRAHEAYETARIYRLLANHRYLLEAAQEADSLE